MDLLDRYLAAVAALLPKDQRQDIVAELRDVLLTRIEAREAELGRTLDRGETEALLKAFGHPIAVAGRFGPVRGLIGPELYPFYAFAVKAALGLAAVVAVLSAGIAALKTGDAYDVVPRAFYAFVSLGLGLIGGLTVIGAAIERGWIRLGRSVDWKVSELPHLGEGWNVGWGGNRRSPLKIRLEALFEAIALVLFILWMSGLVTAPWMVGEVRQGLVLAPAPIWTELRWPILAWACVQLAASLTSVVRPDWVRARAALDLVTDLAGLGFVALFWRSGRLIQVLAEPRVADAASLQRALDTSFQIAVGVAVAVFAIKVGIDLWRLARGRRGAGSGGA
ncbi:MAG: hypothetical protein J7521_00775 [Caulobacter sp.]|nr:hypothetical protein [Caulobacter sp.]